LSKAHETRDSLAVPIRRFSWFISIVAIYFYKLQKTLKTSILEVQGHLRSSMLTPLKSLSLLLVIINSMSVP